MVDKIRSFVDVEEYILPPEMKGIVKNPLPVQISVDFPPLSLDDVHLMEELFHKRPGKERFGIQALDLFHRKSFPWIKDRPPIHGITKGHAKDLGNDINPITSGNCR
jgi:hypothetical protein